MAVKTPDEVFRDYEIDLDPSSGAHQPIKSEIRDLLNAILGSVIPEPVVITTAGTTAVGDTDALIIIKLASPGTVTLNLGLIASRAGLMLIVADSAITAAATVVINPHAGETLAGQSTGGFTSPGTGLGGSIKLFPSEDFSDWMIIP
jgi:hypothetical protein